MKQSAELPGLISRVALGDRQGQGPLGGLIRLDEAAALGIGGRQGPQDRGMIAAGKVAGLPRQFQPPRTVAQRCIGAGRQNPCQIVERG